VAQFRTTADILDLALDNGGEVTNGRSAYEARVLGFMNRVHQSLVAGGTIALLKDVSIQIDETWPWAKSKHPLVLELKPKYTTGNVTITRGSNALTFYPAPPVSLEGYHIKINNRSETFKLLAHDANTTTAYLDGGYPDDSVAGVAFTCFKIDYELVPSYLMVSDSNNKIQFKKTSGGSTLTATLTKGVYSPDDLITEIATKMTTAAGGPTITGDYDPLTRKFSLTSNGAGSTTLEIVGDGSESLLSIHKDIGFDDETSEAALTQEAVYALGGISRLVEPFRINKGSNIVVTGIDPETFSRNYPISVMREGYPDRFCVMSESSDGVFTVRFNKYPEFRTRLEIEKVDVPRDLKDNAASIPLVPRKHVNVLEDAATFYLMLLKNDDRMQIYANLVQAKLGQMIGVHRGQMLRTSEFFGRMIPRRELTKRNTAQFDQSAYSADSTSTDVGTQTLVPVTLDYTDFSAAALTSSVVAETLALNRTIFAVIIKHSTPFSGGVSSLVLDVGITGDTTKFIENFDVMQAVSSSAQDSVLTVYFPGVATDIIVTARAVGSNLSSLTAGVVELFFLEGINS
jgi:hypothetical protein